MSRTKRKDYHTHKRVNDGKQSKTVNGEVRVDRGTYKMDYWDSDYRGVDNPKNKRFLKDQAHRAIRRDGKNIIQKEEKENGKNLSNSEGDSSENRKEY